MRNSKTLPPNEQLDVIKQLRDLSEPEIQAYVSSLKKGYAKYQRPLHAGRKIVNDAMKTASLTEVLYESREQ